MHTFHTSSLFLGRMHTLWAAAEVWCGCIIPKNTSLPSLTCPLGPEMSPTSGRVYIPAPPFTTFSSADTWALNFGPQSGFFSPLFFRHSETQQPEVTSENIPQRSNSWSPATVRSPIREAKRPLAGSAFLFPFFFSRGKGKKYSSNATKAATGCQLQFSSLPAERVRKVCWGGAEEGC